MNNPWAEIDQLKKKMKAEFDGLRSTVYDLDKRAGNSVKVLEDGTGRVRLRFEGVEFVSRDAQDLLRQFKEAHAALLARSKK